MSDQQRDPISDVDAMTDEQRAAIEEEEIARRSRDTGDGLLDKGLGNMGGAGAQGGIQPDVAHIDQPVVKP